MFSVPISIWVVKEKFYKCLKCDFSQEYFHGMTEEPKYYCLECNTLMIKQIGGGAGVVFKGSGFFVNDYGKK